MPGRRIEPRRFDYQPRFYDPERDESMKRRMRVHSAVRSKRRSPGLIRVAFLLAMALYVYILLV